MQQKNNTVTQILAAIRARRKAIKCSQQQVADRLNITQTAYSKLELGSSKMNIDQLAIIAEFLEVELQEFLMSNTTRPPSRDLLALTQDD